jgi:hypothetical protein
MIGQLVKSGELHEFNRADLSVAKSLLARYKHEHQEELGEVIPSSGDGRARHTHRVQFTRDRAVQWNAALELGPAAFGTSGDQVSEPLRQ